jgi:hypothetical protein
VKYAFELSRSSPANHANTAGGEAVERSVHQPSSAAAGSRIAPSSMNTTRSATSRAKLILLDVQVDARVS